MEASLEQSQSQNQEGRCPYCHDQFGDLAKAVCTVCDASQHLECFFEHKSCSVHGCENAVISHEGVVFSYAEMQAFEGFKDFLFFVEETLALNHGQGVAESPKILTKTRLQVKYWAIFLALLLYPAFLFVLRSLFPPSTPHEVFLNNLLNIFCFLGIFLYSIRLETVESSPEEEFEAHHARRVQERLEGQALQLTPFSFWRDVMGQRGFDPLTGMSPGTLELPILEDDEERQRSPKGGAEGSDLEIDDVEMENPPS